MHEQMLLRPNEVAFTMGISRTKVYQLIATSELPSVRIGGSVRVPLAELQAWIDARMVGGRTDTPEDPA